jgi:hypothetical protein
MQTIIIIGDSWPAGVWGHDNEIIEMGISKFYLDHGYHIINLSQPGADPFGLLYPLDAFLRVNFNLDIESVFYFQTDIMRSFDFIKRFSNLSDTVDNGYQDLYSRLNDIAKKNNKIVNIIGGLTDVTIDLSTYDNLNLLLPSWCQLFDQSISTVRLMDQEKFEFLHHHYPKHQILPYLEETNARYDFFDQRKDIFWPNKTHPNVLGHKILFDHLTKNIANLVAKSK